MSEETKELYWDRKGNPITYEQAQEYIKNPRRRIVSMHKVGRYVVCTIHLVIKEYNQKTKEVDGLFKTDVKSKHGIHYYEHHTNVRAAMKRHEAVLEQTTQHIKDGKL